MLRSSRSRRCAGHTHLWSAPRPLPLGGCFWSGASGVGSTPSDLQRLAAAWHGRATRLSREAAPALAAAAARAPSRHALAERRRPSPPAGRTGRSVRAGRAGGRELAAHESVAAAARSCRPAGRAGPGPAVLGPPRARALGRDRQRGKRDGPAFCASSRSPRQSGSAQQRSTCMPWTAAAGACGLWSSSPTPALWSAMTTGPAGAPPAQTRRRGVAPAAGPRRAREHLCGGMAGVPCQRPCGLGACTPPAAGRRVGVGRPGPGCPRPRSPHRRAAAARAGRRLGGTPRAPHRRPRVLLGRTGSVFSQRLLLHQDDPPQRSWPAEPRRLGLPTSHPGGRCLPARARRCSWRGSAPGRNRRRRCRGPGRPARGRCPAGPVPAAASRGRAPLRGGPPRAGAASGWCRWSARRARRRRPRAVDAAPGPRWQAVAGCGRLAQRQVHGPCHTDAVAAGRGDSRGGGRRPPRPPRRASRPRPRGLLGPASRAL